MVNDRSVDCHHVDLFSPSRHSHRTTQRDIFEYRWQRLVAEPATDLLHVGSDMNDQIGFFCRAGAELAALEADFLVDLSQVHPDRYPAIFERMPLLCTLQLARVPPSTERSDNRDRDS